MQVDAPLQIDASLTIVAFDERFSTSAFVCTLVCKLFICAMIEPWPAANIRPAPSAHPLAVSSAAAAVPAGVLAASTIFVHGMNWFLKSFASSV